MNEPDADERLSAHQMLRQGTGAAHARLDAMFGRYDLTDTGDYARFLAAHAAAVLPLEAALDATGMAGLLDDWGERRRGALIRADLAALGCAPTAPLPFALEHGAAAAWGAAYVIEGSRLGGAMLVREVPAELPRAYLATPLPKGAWRKFLARLDEALYPEAMRAPALRSASATFDLFEAAAAAARA